MSESPKERDEEAETGKAFVRFMEQFSKSSEGNYRERRKRRDTIAAAAELAVAEVVNKTLKAERTILGMSPGELLKFLMMLIGAMLTTYLSMRGAIDANTGGIDSNATLVRELRDETRSHRESHNERLKVMERKGDKLGFQINQIVETTNEIKADIKPRWRKRK